MPPIPYGGADAGGSNAAFYIGNLAAYGNGATPAQQASKTLRKTAQAANASPVTLTGSFQLVANLGETLTSGEKVILTGSIAATVAAIASGALVMQIEVDGVAVGGPITAPFTSDALGVSVSFTFEAAPAVGPHNFSVFAKYTSVGDPPTATIPTGLGVIVEQIVTV